MTTTTPPAAALGDLGRARRAAGLTQSQLALAAGIAPETIRRIERGHGTTRETAAKIAAAFDTLKAAA